jgi:CPA2 family monovalent cation:H+ antiporter-2
MLLDPKVLVEYWPYILTISILTMVAKMISTFLGAILAGKDLPTSFRAGLTLAQIGEFSFIIATLGSELKVTSDFLYPIAISVSVITSFATPYLVMNSDPIYQWLLPRIPQKFLTSVQNYSQAINDRRTSKNFISIFFEMYGLKILINSIIIVSITLFFAQFVLPEMKNRFTSRFQMELIMLSGALLLCLPFFGPILFGRPSKSLSKMQISVDRAKAYHLGIILCRCLVALFLILFIIGQFSALAAISSFLVLSLGLIYLPISRYAQWIYHYFENGFVENLKKEK